MTKPPLRRQPLFQRIRNILESARAGVARTVNTTQVVANWLIGREIVEEQQRGEKRAGYGQRLMRELSRRLQTEFGRGYSVDNLEWFRQFYLDYPRLLDAAKSDAVRRISSASGISDAVRRKLDVQSAESDVSRPPGQLNPNLSWTHYRTLLCVEQPEARSFYEIEALRNNWSARELERQVNSLLYTRLAMSRDKKGLLRLARKGQEIQGPFDIFKDPVVLEFLTVPTTTKLAESDLETALLNELQAFLLELGRGFAFVARQERITLDGDHFYIDLVFYHIVLKCYVLLDLKVGKLTHQDIGQLELYVNYYDQNRLTPGDNPTLGLILCTDKNDTVVRYTLGPEKSRKIFASRYKLHVPSEARLKAELQREFRRLNAPTQKRELPQPSPKP